MPRGETPRPESSCPVCKSDGC